MTEASPTGGVPPPPPPLVDPLGRVVVAAEPPASPPKSPNINVSTTAVAALSGAGAGDTIMWIFECIQKHQLVTPETDLATLWGAALMPLGHALYLMVMRKLA